MSGGVVGVFEWWGLGCGCGGRGWLGLWWEWGSVEWGGSNMGVGVRGWGGFYF